MYFYVHIPVCMLILIHSYFHEMLFRKTRYIPLLFSQLGDAETYMNRTKRDPWFAALFFDAGFQNVMHLIISVYLLFNSVALCWCLCRWWNGPGIQWFWGCCEPGDSWASSHQTSIRKQLRGKTFWHRSVKCFGFVCIHQKHVLLCLRCIWSFEGNSYQTSVTECWLV